MEEEVVVALLVGFAVGAKAVGEGVAEEEVVVRVVLLAL